MATPEIHGATSFSSCTRLPSRSGPETVNPVTLPPGRAKLATSPPLTGLPLDAKTMGIVVVDDLRRQAHQFSRQPRQPIVLSLCPAVLDGDVLTLDMAQF